MNLLNLLRLLFYRKGWLIGPFVDGVRYSRGLRWRPSRTATGWRFTLGPESEVDYVTRETGPLSGSIRVHYRASGEFAAVEGGQAGLTLHFQRVGDDWSALGKFATYRWYSIETFPLSGEHDITIPLTPDKWFAVLGQPGESIPEDFAATLQRASRVGLCFGNPAGRGHGVTGNGTFELLDFSHA